MRKERRFWMRISLKKIFSRRKDAKSEITQPYTTNEPCFLSAGIDRKTNEFPSHPEMPQTLDREVIDKHEVKVVDGTGREG